jgi:hypothetical protein
VGVNLRRRKEQAIRTRRIRVRDLKGPVDRGIRNREYPIDDFPITLDVWVQVSPTRTGGIIENRHIGVQTLELQIC